MPFEVIETQNLFSGKVFNVRRDKVRKKDGGVMELDVVEHHDSVTILPLDDDGNIWFVSQYRHPAGEFLLELPAGVIEVGESQAECANREIQEEIGMRAGRLEEVGGFYLVPGYSTEFMHIFLARDLHPSSLEGDEDEIILVEKISLDKAYSMAETGLIKDVKSLGALLLLKPVLYN
ncbi:MAG: NUDIX hydrolase [Anaerolineales bacterium]